MLVLGDMWVSMLLGVMMCVVVVLIVYVSVVSFV